MKTMELQNRIWETYEKKRKVSRVLSRGGAAAVLAVGGLLLVALPRPALALEEVLRATKDFKRVQWTQVDEGVIRDLGSENPKRVPYYYFNREHFVERNPLDVRVFDSNWGGWRHQPGDFEMAIASLAFYEEFDKRLAAQAEIAYNGRRAIEFILRFQYWSNQLAIEIVADLETKKLISQEVEIRDSEGSRILYRRISSIRYDGPAPK